MSRGAWLVLAVALTACAAERTPGQLPSRSELVREACPPAPLGRAFQASLPGAGRHDPALLDRAILHAVNRARCDQRLAPLMPEGALRNAAELHNRDMVRLDFFGHTSPVNGRTNIGDRLDLVGARYRRAAENLLEERFLAYQSGRQYQIIDPVRCQFVYTDGTKIQRHTYASLGQQAVQRWLDSPGHRRNLLDPALTRHGAALIANNNTSLCGGAFVTQVFAG